MNSNIKYRSSNLELLEDLCTILLYLSFIVFSTNSLGIYYMITFVSVIYLLHCLCTRFQLSFHKGVFHCYILLISIFCLLSAIWAQQSSYAIEKGLTLLELLAIFSLLYEVYYYTPERLLKCLKWAGFILSIYTIIFVGIDNLSDTIGNEGRMENSFANVNVIGMCCSTSVLLAFFYGRIKRSMIDMILCLPALFIVAVSGSRKALIMLVLGLIYIILSQRKGENNSGSARKRILSIIGATLFLVIFIYVIAKTGLFSGTLSRMEGLIASITGKGDADSSSILREYYRYLGFEQFLKTPILGIGMGNPRLIALQYTGNDCYLHCNYAEVAAGGGIVGLVLIYWIYIKLWKAEFKTIKSDQYASMMLFLILLNLVLDYGMVSYYSKSTIFIILILCLHYESIMRKRKAF